MRFAALLHLVLLGGCASTGSARTTQKSARPLGHYSPVILRVTPLVAAAQEAAELEAVVAARMRTACGFPEVLTASSTPNAQAALLVDARIALLERVSREERAAYGAMAGQARMVVAVDFIDLATKKRVAAAEVEGVSSGGATLAGGTEEAMERVVEKIVEVMTQNGCQTRAPRTAAAPPEEKELPPAVQAEALNQQGKDAYKAKDYAGAAEKFQAAIAIAPEARYSFNLCAAYDQLGKKQEAIKACEDVLAKHPEDELKAKTEKKLEALK